MITPDVYVKLFFRSGMIAEGIVEKWDWQEGDIVLKSENGDMLVVFDPSEIIAAKLARSDNNSESYMEPMDEELFDEPDKDYDTYGFTEDPEPDLSHITDPDLRAQTLIELRKYQAQLHQQRIAQRINSFEPNNLPIDPMEKYGTPAAGKLRTQPGPFKYTTQENSKFPPGSYGRMRKMQGKASK